MVELGIVVKNDENGIEVQMQPTASCGSCNACLMDKSKVQSMFINQKMQVLPGQVVEVEVKPGFAIQSAFLVFFLPLIMLMAGYFLFQSLNLVSGVNTVYQGIIGGLTALFLTYVGVHYYDKSLQDSGRGRQVRILRVIN
ncbi:MAG: SoxR reducing system RseC family protein [Calditrichia bacterium]